MKKIRIKMEKMSKILISIGYILCIVYMVLFNVLYKLTGFPYSLVMSMLLVGLLHMSIVKKININARLRNIVFFILLYFLIAFILYHSETTSAYFLSFATLGFIGIYFGRLDVSAENVIRGCSLCFVVYMFFIGGFEDFTSDYFNSSNTILPGICTCFMYAVILKKHKKLLPCVIWFAFFAFFSVYLITGGSRSSVVSLCGFMVLYIFIFTKYKVIKAGIIIALGCASILVMNIENVIRFLDKWLRSKNISIYFVTKSIEKMSGSGILSGRGIIAKKVFKFDNVGQMIWGRGISGFDSMSGTYPHNLILNFFTDYGLIGIIFLIGIFICVCKLLKVDNEDNKMLLILIIGSCVLPLLFSFTYWRYPAFFLFISIVLARSKKLGVGVLRKRKRVKLTINEGGGRVC